MTSDLDTLIEAMVNAQCDATAASRERHILREALRGLARVAQAEQRLFMRQTVQRLVGAPMVAPESESGAS